LASSSAYILRVSRKRLPYGSDHAAGAVNGAVALQLTGNCLAFAFEVELEAAPCFASK
jgi:hypothetical protein